MKDLKYYEIMAAVDTHPVQLYVYDLSQGLAAAISQMLIGKQIDGVWHTAIVVYNREYFFGSQGVETCRPGGTALGEPLKKIKLGDTQVPYSVFIDYLNGLSESTYAAHTYDLFHHNCNNFSNELAHFLCGVGIPQYILDLPNEVLNTNLAGTLQSLGVQLERSARPLESRAGAPQVETNNSGAGNQVRRRAPSPEFDQLNSQVEEARYNSFLLEQRRRTLKEKLAKKERKREKKRRKLLKEHGQIDIDDKMAEAETASVQNGGDVASDSSQLPSEQAMAMEEEERREIEAKKKLREPPIVYKDIIDVKSEFDALLTLIDGKLNAEEQRSTEELHQYMLGDEGSWALSDGFLDFINRLLNDKQLSVDVRVKVLNILAMAALKDDVILVLHQDRKDHILMNYAFEIDRLSIPEQEAIALFITNMFENLNSSEWLLYISEWTYNNQQTSNIRVTTKVAVHCLLSDSETLQERGSAIIHNLACKEVKSVVFDDVAVELTMALLQFFNNKPNEEMLFRCMKALAKFCQVSSQEVPQLIQMIGPDPRTFKGTSQRVDDLIEQISTRSEEHTSELQSQM